MSTYQERRAANIVQNAAILDDIAKIQPVPLETARAARLSKTTSAKKRFLPPAEEPRRSSRVAQSTSKPVYTDDDKAFAAAVRPAKRTKTSRSSTTALASPPPSPDAPARAPKIDPATLEDNWYNFSIDATSPTRDDQGTFHFESHPIFTPNLSPLEMLSQGAFGGQYYRPVYSRKLGTTIRDDWKYLPSEWLSELDVDTQLINPEYDPERNKFGVKCGQSIEEWEAAGWINYEWDIRGWFQWYERFFRGRRGDDDERQVGRWARCVGPRGRWRSALVKAYRKQGVRYVADEGMEEDEISPVLCQTCHHWAWEMRQEYLDEIWAA